MGATDKFAKLYGVLTGPERFRLVMEAAARGDRVEEERLDAACPRAAYVIDDPEYRGRMTACAVTTLVAWSMIAQELAGARVAHALASAAEVYLDWTEEAAEAAFVAGWQAAQPDGADDRDDDGSSTPPDGASVDTATEDDEPGDHEPAAEREGRGDPDDPDDLWPELEPAVSDRDEQDAGGTSTCPFDGEELAELRAAAREPLEKLGAIALARVGRARAAAALSAWAGYARFCRAELGMEPETVMAAWTRGAVEAVESVRAMYPDAEVDEAAVGHWAETFAHAWRRRFPAEGGAGRDAART